MVCVNGKTIQINNKVSYCHKDINLTFIDYCLKEFDACFFDI